MSVCFCPPSATHTPNHLPTHAPALLATLLCCRAPTAARTRWCSACQIPLLPKRLWRAWQLKGCTWTHDVRMCALGSAPTTALLTWTPCWQRCVQLLAVLAMQLCPSEAPHRHACSGLRCCSPLHVYHIRCTTPCTLRVGIAPCCTPRCLYVGGRICRLSPSLYSIASPCIHMCSQHAAPPCPLALMLAQFFNGALAPV